MNISTELKTKDVSMALVDRLNSFKETLNEYELDNYRLLLGMAAGGFSNLGTLVDDGQKEISMKVICKCLAAVGHTGILWRGRPNFLTDDLLHQLQQESIAVRENAGPHDRHLLGIGGDIAHDLAKSKSLLDFVHSHANHTVLPTNVASYLYYDTPGSGLDPHIDTKIFTLNMIIMLKHDYENSSPSHLIVYSEDGVMTKLLLTPGECVFLYAGNTVHAREDVKEGESISILTIGFIPQQDG